MTGKTRNPDSPRLAPDPAELSRLVAGVHHDPHSILGAHEYGEQTVIRTLRPHATEVAAVVGGVRHPMSHIDAGLFAVALPFTDLVDYRLEVRYPTNTLTTADGYRFLPTLGEVDLHLFAEGRHERLWEILGAQPRSFTTADGPVDGVSFAVWAPSAALVATPVRVARASMAPTLRWRASRARLAATAAMVAWVARAAPVASV